MCRGCARHQGDSREQLKLRDLDHLNLWQSEVQLLLEQKAEQVSLLAAAIADREHTIDVLKGELDEMRKQLLAEIGRAPEGSVRTWFDSLLIQKAEDEVTRAFRSRDHVLRVLWEVDWGHHSDQNRKTFCTCGEQEKVCEVWRDLDPVRNTLYKWERKNLERLERGLDHALPRRHPRVVAAERPA